MTPTESLPLLVVVVLLVAAGGTTADQMSVVYGGERTAEATDGVLVVAGGTVTVPGGATVDGPLYVIGGTARVDGRLDGDVTVLAGNLTVGDGAAVTGTLQTVAGDVTVSPSAAVGARTSLPVETRAGGPLGTLGGLLLQFAVLGGAAFWLRRRHPVLLDNVGRSVTEHTLVSGVVGALAAATLLVLFVYMAFTLLLLPVSVLGLLGEVVAVLYGFVVYGDLLGRRLPVARKDVATVAGVGVFVAATELLGRVPYLGVLVQLALVVVGFGAVLLTYFGLRRFEPAAIPGGGR